MSHTEPIKPISNRIRKQYRVFSRRKLAELRTFYRRVMNEPKTAINVRMNAAERLQELFQMELEERQLLDAQEREQERQERGGAEPAQPVAADSAPEEPSDYERAEASSAYAKAVSDHFARIAERVKKEGK